MTNTETTPPISRFAVIANTVRRGEFLYLPNGIRTQVLSTHPETDDEGRILIRFACLSGSLTVGADSTVHLAL